MPFSITRIYESDVDIFGVGVDESEVHGQGGVFIIGLETNAEDINDFPSGTEITIVQGDLITVISIIARLNLLSDSVYYSYSLTSGDFSNFIDEASTYVTDDLSLLQQQIELEPSNVTFGTPERFDDDTIKIPVNFADDSDNPEDIEILEVSDFDIREVNVLSSFIRGEDSAYNLFVIPKPETFGVMEVEMTGKVYKSNATAVGNSSVPVSPILLVPYNTIEPRIISKFIPSLMIAGSQSAYIDFNREVIGINPQVFIVSGADIGQPKIYAAPSPIVNLPTGSRPLDVLYAEYNNSDTPRRYFRLDFEFPDPPPIGSLSIDLIGNSVSGYIDPDATTDIP